MIGDDGEGSDPAVVQDDVEDIKAFLRHENEELAREVKDLIIAVGGNAGKTLEAGKEEVEQDGRGNPQPSSCDGNREAIAQWSVARFSAGLDDLGRGGNAMGFRHPVAEEKS